MKNLNPPVKKRIKWVGLLALVCAAAFLAIVNVAPRTTAPTKKQNLRIALCSGIPSLSTASSYDNNALQVMGMVFEGLMRRGKEDIPQLALADSYTISSDKKCYTFYLKDAFWSDGKQITAQDFVFTWTNALDLSSKFLTKTPKFFYPIKNAKRALFGQVPVKEVPIRAIDEKTFFVELEHPSPYFLDLLTLPCFFPLPMHAVRAATSPWGSDSSVLYNGPFMVKEWKKNNILTLVKNPLYWDRKNVQLEQIDINIIEDPQTALNMFTKGSLDWVGSPFFRMSYDISSEALFYEKEDVFTCWFFINTEKHPLDNKKLRQALSYAIDRKSIVKNAFSNAATSATSPIAPPLALKAEGCFQDGNTLFAQQLFSEALEELGLDQETFPSIELSYVTGSELQNRIVQAIQDQWRKALGITNLSLRKADWIVHRNNVRGGDYDIGFMGFTSNVLDPLFVLYTFRDKEETSNISNWESQEYKNYLERAALTTDHSERRENLLRAESLLMEEMPVIPLCFLNKRYGKNPKLQGENLSSLSFIDFKTAYFESDQMQEENAK